MTKTSTRIKTEALADSPQTLDEVNTAIADIGRCQRARDRFRADMNDALAATRTSYEAKAAPYAERISQLQRGVAAYCEAHRVELTRDGKTKTAKLATGEVSWRMRPPSVRVSKPLAVIEALTHFKLTRLLRIKTDIDKDAVLREPDAIAGIKGLSIVQKEDFVIKPDSTELEEVR